MSILQIKPYRLAKYTLTEGHEDERGDYIEGGETLGDWLICDAVPSGEAAEKTFEDGATKTYSFTCYLNGDCPIFEIGDKVRLQRGEIDKDYIVKGFHRYQHQAKLWL